MSADYVEEYARRMGISVAEAMEHAVVKEYLKEHARDKKGGAGVSRTRLVAGCGSAGMEESGK